jgi:hypothetical protein
VYSGVTGLPEEIRTVNEEEENEFAGVVIRGGGVRGGGPPAFSLFPVNTFLFVHLIYLFISIHTHLVLRIPLSPFTASLSFVFVYRAPPPFPSLFGRNGGRLYSNVQQLARDCSAVE